MAQNCSQSLTTASQVHILRLFSSFPSLLPASRDLPAASAASIPTAFLSPVFSLPRLSFSFPSPSSLAPSLASNFPPLPFPASSDAHFHVVFSHCLLPPIVFSAIAFLPALFQLLPFSFPLPPFPLLPPFPTLFLQHSLQLALGVLQLFLLELVFPVLLSAEQQRLALHLRILF